MLRLRFIVPLMKRWSGLLNPAVSCDVTLKPQGVSRLHAEISVAPLADSTPGCAPCPLTWTDKSSFGVRWPGPHTTSAFPCVARAQRCTAVAVKFQVRLEAKCASAGSSRRGVPGRPSRR